MLILSFDWILHDSLKKDLQENVPWLLKRRFRIDLFDSNMELLFMVGLEWALDDMSYLNTVLFPSNLPLSLHYTLALDTCTYGQ